LKGIEMLEVGVEALSIVCPQPTPK